MLDIVARMLSDPNPSVRTRAAAVAQSLGWSARPLATSLARLLDDPSDEVKVAAAAALGAVGPGARDVLARLYASFTSQDPVVRGQILSAVAAVANEPSAKVATLLIGALDDEDADVRRRAAVAIRALLPDADTAVPALIRALRDEEIAVRQEAAAALGGYGRAAERAVPELQHAMLDRDVEPVAACALERIRFNNDRNDYPSMMFRSRVAALGRWPPPTPSADYQFDANFLTQFADFREAHTVLVRVLQSQGFSVRTIAIPGGYAIVSDFERFDPRTGLTYEGAARKSRDYLPTESFIQNVKQFFKGEDGNYRAFMFAITDQTATVQVPGLTYEDLRAWAHANGELLPNQIASASLVGKKCAALVYHFVERQRVARLKEESDISGLKHLEAAGLWAALQWSAAR